MVGMSRENTTCRPVASTSQPITSSVSRHSVLRAARISSAGVLPAAGGRSAPTTSAAAAPSENSEVATRLRRVTSLRWKVRLQSSSATSSTRDPGCASARSRARASPAAPPAQPSPHSGVREMSPRNGSAFASRASRLGVASPVEDTNTR